MASPQVVDDSSSGEACSGGYGELGDFLLEEREEEEEDDELRGHFEQAAQHAQKLAHVATTQQLLYLYARYKQVKVGKCTTSKPGFFDFEGRQKWEAWKSLGDYSCQQAMRDYVDTVKKLDPDWKPKESEEPVEKHKTTFGGPVVSCLYKVQETLRDEDKDIFDYCRENDISRISQALATGTIDVNVADDEGRSLLHWACDRGRTELVSILLFHNAHINMQNVLACGRKLEYLEEKLVIPWNHWKLHKKMTGCDVFSPCHLGFLSTLTEPGSKTFRAAP